MNQFSTTMTTMKAFCTGAQAKCADIMQNARDVVFGSRDLYKFLIVSGHLKDDQDYDDVTSDGGFMLVLRDELASGLEKDPVKSLYGNGMISEYDLYWKVNTDTELCHFFKSKNINLTTDQFITLKNERRYCKKFVTDTRTTVLMNMGIPETPLTKKEQSQLLTKTDEQIQADINKRIEKNLQSKKNDAKKRRIIDDEAVEGLDGDDAMDESTLSSQPESTSGTVPQKYASSRCKFFFCSFFYLSHLLFFQGQSVPRINPKISSLHKNVLLPTCYHG